MANGLSVEECKSAIGAWPTVRNDAPFTNVVIHMNSIEDAEKVARWARKGFRFASRRKNVVLIQTLATPAQIERFVRSRQLDVTLTQEHEARADAP